MKKFITLILFAAIAQITFAQTVLNPGDVAIVQVNYSYHSFDFVTFVNLEAGTKIRFTDYAYSATLSDLDQTSTSDGIYEYTAPAVIAAGTVIQYKINSTVNSAFTTIAGGALTLYSYKNSYSLAGENLISFQQSASTKTYLFALGWMRKDNFAINPYNPNAKVCDIPTGLSKSNFTVIQIDSVMKPGQTPQLARDFRYNKYDGFTGTASKIRFWLSNTLNYSTFSGSYDNNAVSDFTVFAPDTQAPTLVYSYPRNNKLNTSISGIGTLKFDEPVIIKKGITITDVNSGQVIKTYIASDLSISNDSVVNFNLDPYLAKSSSYTLTIPENFVTDFDGNGWPASVQVYSFATAANRSTVELCFGGDEEIIINPTYNACSYREDISWTTISRSVVYEQNWCSGYYSWTQSGVPVRYYTSKLVNNDTDIPHSSDLGSSIWIRNDGRLVVDLTSINHTVTDVLCRAYDNNSAFFQTVYNGGQKVNEKTFSAPGGGEGYLHFDNENSVNIDSVVFGGFEGRLEYVKLDIIDKSAPVVELGNNRVLCEGDSVQLDAGLTLGAVYDWSTGAKTQKIWAKTSDTYSVTVKNTLGQATDNVQVTVKPIITLSMPDTIYACVGDTVTLIAGTNTENSYFWSPGAQTTPTLKVTKSGIYHVLVNNGFGGCFNTDSTRVIFKGAKLHAYHYQGGIYSSGDVIGELYRKNSDGKISLYRQADMLQSVQFDSLPKGDYIFKSHFVNYSYAGQNPWMDTYHDGNTEWKKVTPFKLTCETDTMIGFLIASKPSFVFNGTGVISGKVNITGQPINSPMHRAKAKVNVDCETRVVLYNATGDIIATTCPDANGNYSFTNLPAGDYTVGIERTGFEVQSVFTTTVAEGTTISNADFTINQAEQTVIQGISTGISNAVVGNSLKLHLIPNPAVNATMLEFDLATDCNVTISVSDLTGRVIQKDIRLLSSGKNRFPLAVDNLSGIYFVKVSTVAGYSIARLIVQ